MHTPFGTWSQKERETLADLRFPLSYVSTPLQSIFPKPQAEQVFGLLNIDIKDVDRSGATIDGNQFRTVIELGLRGAAKDQSLGLLFAQHINVATHGIYGFAAISADTLGDALELADKYLCHVMPALTLENDIKAQTSETTLIMEPAFGAAGNVIAEVSAKVMVDIMSYAQQAVVLIKIEFAHEAPCRSAMYEEFFSCSVEFGCENNKVIFEHGALDLPMKTRDKATSTLLQQNLQKDHELQTQQKSWTLKLKQEIKRRMMEQRYTDKESVAAEFNFTSRTLARKLQKEDTTYQIVLESIRLELADELLRSSSKSISEIASVVGFQEVRTFNRAFKRWTGKTPGAVRESSS